MKKLSLLRSLFSVVCLSLLSNLCLLAQRDGADPIVSFASKSRYPELNRSALLRTSGQLDLCDDADKSNAGCEDVKADEKVSEQSKRRGYIGLNMGIAFESNASQTGLGSELDFGYLFHPNVGLGAKLYVRSYWPEDDVTVSVGGIMVGPKFSISLLPKLSLDLDPMFGYGTAMIENSVLDTRLGFSVRAQFRINANERICVLGGICFTKISYYKDVTISFGVGYRI